MNKIDAQQARRILDRLVGYEISPILWNKVQRGLSAGRVQSVAVRLVSSARRRSRRSSPRSTGRSTPPSRAPTPPPFEARRSDAGTARRPSRRTRGRRARSIDATSSRRRRVVASVERKERRKKPPPPFITSKLQQDAARKLRFSAKRTMALAQRLYEGVELGDDGPIGLITYMRTDSTRISDDALDRGARVHQRALRRRRTCRPSRTSTRRRRARRTPTRRSARRGLKYDPETVRALWARGKGGGRDERESDDLLRLYTLIWQRFVASQMVPAVFDQTTIDIAAGRAELRATGQVMKFAGYRRGLRRDRRGRRQRGRDRRVAARRQGRRRRSSCSRRRPEQHFTQPPPRFSEASLVKELEENGIGRPSTYAAIMSTIQDRGYVEKKEARFYPTELGILVNGLLVEELPGDREHRLHGEDGGGARSRRGGRGRTGSSCSTEFYTPFKLELEKAKTEMRDVKREENPTDEVCEKCGKPMVIKWGRNGHFLACPGYPECRNTKEVVQEPRRHAGRWCRDADHRMRSARPAARRWSIKRGRFGEFLACTQVPRLQDDQADVARREVPEARLRRLHHREAVAARQAVLRLLELGEEPSATSCRGIGRCRSRARSAAPSSCVQKVSKAGVRIRCINEGCDYTADPGIAERAEPTPADTRASCPARRPDRHLKLTVRAHQRRDRLDVLRLREHVERLHAQTRDTRRRPARAMSRACVSGLHDT